MQTHPTEMEESKQRRRAMVYQSVRSALMKFKSMVFVTACALFAPCAMAQEAMYTEAATMPSPGTFVLRQQYHYEVHGRNPRTGSETTEHHEWMSTLQFGLVRGLSLQVDVPVQFRTEEFTGGDDDYDKGVEDIDLTLKWRFFQSDTGGVDTLRAALLVGTSVPSGDDHDFSSPGVMSPLIGGVVTLVRGRHGFNQDLKFRWNTNGSEDFNFGGEGPSEAIMHGSAYLYRIFPERYTSTSTGAWYATVEVNGIYETNGDYELMWAPGLMYEGQLFALELMGQLPLYQAVSSRPELDYRLGIGLRFAF